MNIHLIVCPLAVGSSWMKTGKIAAANNTELWSHQERAANHLLNNPFIFMIVRMGGGKSLSLLAGLGLLGKDATYISLCQRGWGSKKKARELQKAIDKNPEDLVIVVNYDVFKTPNIFSKMIDLMKFKSISLDESQRIKSPRSKSAAFLRRLAKKNPDAKRACLTGTPIPHSVFDLWGQLQFLDPAIYPHSFTAWKHLNAVLHPDLHFPVKWINQEVSQNIMDKHAFIPSEEEYLELPELIVDQINIELSPLAKRIYKDLRADMISKVNEGVITAANAAVRTTRLRQTVAGHFKFDDSPEVFRIGDLVPDKIQALKDFMHDVHESEPVVVFCELRAELEEVQELARLLDRPYAEVSGAPPKHAKTLEDFQSGDASMIGVQSRAGGEGIDLSRASLGFFYSLPWSLGLYHQTLARLHRPGQKKTCRFYQLIANKTLDQKVQRALFEQKNVVDFILRG